MINHCRLSQQLWLKVSNCSSNNNVIENSNIFITVGAAIVMVTDIVIETEYEVTFRIE